MSNANRPVHRRSILRLGLQATAAGIAASVTWPARAASADRALVYIYLSGGNDSNNMIVPLADYASYSAARADLAIPKDQLLPVTAGGSQAEFGLHPAMAELADLFRTGVLAVVTNTGTSGVVPQDHSDPLMTYLPGGYMAPRWSVQWSRQPVTGFDGVSTGSGAVVMMSRNGGATINRQHVSRAAKAAGAWKSVFPDSALGTQLRQVAGSISASGSAGQRVYMVNAAGFDTHSHQLDQQRELLGDLSASMAAFYRVTKQMGIDDRVVTLTDTEFNRALAPNGAGGTDHGWGGHQLVLGGSVLGGQVHGAFPALKPGGPQDATGAGVWTPSVSRSAYLAVAAAWLGLDSTETLRLLPGSNSGSRAPEFLA